jgi:hypothetical protein
MRHIAAVLACLAVPAPLAAAEVTVLDESGACLELALTGTIDRGDPERLALVLGRTVSGRGRIRVLIWLNSGGGDLKAGLRLASVVLDVRRRLATGGVVATVVGADDECDSACVPVFGAGQERLLVAGGRIGLHRGSEQGGNEGGSSGAGGESVASRSDTIVAADLLHSFGLPASAVGRMVTTPPGEMSYLTAEELATMRVRVLNSIPR